MKPNGDVVVLSLGSNLGDRLQNLKAAVELLSVDVLSDIRVSPVVETAAWVKPGAPKEWMRPYLNLVIEAKSILSAGEAFKFCQSVELKLGRKAHEIWAPRTIDVDILLWNSEEIETAVLQIPHAGMRERPFVMDPWMALSPGRSLRGPRTVLNQRRLLTDSCPILMGIVNVTPDSFSDGGENFSEAALKAYFKRISHSPPSIIDLGAQLTRPGAVVVGESEEWSRLERALRQVEEIHKDRVRPWISIDTFRGSLAARAVEWGVELINDVSGFNDPEMIELAASTEAQFIFMHHLGVPVKPGTTLRGDCDPVLEVKHWALEKVNKLVQAGISMDRLIFDPGIGFGKTSEQSQALVNRVAEFKDLPVRVLVGHSRKAYQRLVKERHTHLDLQDIDAVTIHQSLDMAASGVEFLRVHNVLAHRKAFLQYFSQERGK